jgi:hypothetical protein
METKYSIAQAVLTAALSLGVGLIVFVMGQWYLKYVIEPLAEHRKIKSQISQALVFYANMYSNPVDYPNVSLSNEIIKSERNDASLQLRKLASEYTGSIQVIPFYNMWQLFKAVPSKTDATHVAKCLIGLSNSLWSRSSSTDFTIDHNMKRVKEIVEILKFHQP